MLGQLPADAAGHVGIVGGIDPRQNHRNIVGTAPFEGLCHHIGHIAKLLNGPLQPLPGLRPDIDLVVQIAGYGTDAYPRMERNIFDGCYLAPLPPL